MIRAESGTAKAKRVKENIGAKNFDRRRRFATDKLNAMIQNFHAWIDDRTISMTMRHAIDGVRNHLVEIRDVLDGTSDVED